MRISESLPAMVVSTGGVQYIKKIPNISQQIINSLTVDSNYNLMISDVILNVSKTVLTTIRSQIRRSCH